MDPAIICTTGRTKEEFDNQGTGDRILFQNGPTENDVMEIALTQDEMATSVRFDL